MFSLPSMFMSMSASISEEGSVSNETRVHVHDYSSLNSLSTSIGNPLILQQHEPQSQGSQQLINTKKKRSHPGHPDPDAEVVALSPKTLMASNRFVCEICNKGFQRDQNLQLHRRGHNLPWKLRQKSSKGMVKKKVYVCPEPSCVHHHPSRALGDLTGIKKHFSRKHGEKKWKCDKCSKKYAVQSDWKAHVKACGTREYRCDCGTVFSRKDSFTTHRAFCDALAEESAKLTAAVTATSSSLLSSTLPLLPCQVPFTVAIPNTVTSPGLSITSDHQLNSLSISFNHDDVSASLLHRLPTSTTTGATPHLSATALLRRACSLGPMSTNMGYGAIEALGRNMNLASADLDVGYADGGRRWGSGA